MPTESDPKPSAGALTEPAEQPSPEGTAVLYSLSGRFAGQQVGGSAKLQWKLDPTAYLVSLQVTGSHQFSTLFAWTATTTGTASPTEMRPESFDEEFQDARGHQAHSLAFPSAETPGASTTDQGLPLDPLSALFKLSSELYALRQAAANPVDGMRLPTITVRLSTRTLELTFEREGDETLSSPFGLLRTEKFVTTTANGAGEEPVISLWLAPEFRYAPARVQVNSGATTAVRLDLFSEPADFPTWR